MASHTGLRALSIVGFIIASYASYVEFRHWLDPNYVALCDFGPKMSCSKVFNSEYGALLLLPNAVWGMVFYCMTFYLAGVGKLKWLKVLSLVSSAGSLGLAYILFFILEDFCVVCTATYCVNFAMLGASFLAKPVKGSGAGKAKAKKVQ